ncbi:cupin-like domain-containing protein [Pendulispora albinea]|uniref:Cupin-like domain-containing protein n=1 Tax=Pendulispora albinea TaxID=2741071 RepID=A0ABZ2LRF9_9BACT
MPAPSREAFEGDIVPAQRPVIFTGLFAGEPVDAIRSLEQAVEAWGSVPLAISQEYSHNDFESQRDGYDVPDRKMSLAEYADFIAREPGTRWMCTEQRTPEHVARSFRRTSLAGVLEEDGDDVPSFFFFGNGGNHANFHFDGDMRATLLHHVAGRKRVFLVPPHEAEKMMPVKNFSRWLFYRFTEEERARFLAFADGWSAALEPGETLFIPTAWWHHLDYVEPAISINFRLRRNKALQLLGSGKLHIDHKLQALAVRMLQPLPADRDRFERIVRALAEPLSPADKLRAMARLYDRLLDELRAETGARAITGRLTDDETSLWARGLRRGTLYPERAVATSVES